MNRKFLIIILTVFAHICVAQEEVFFNDINIDKKDIKVSKKLHGFEFGIDAIRILPSFYSARNFGSIVSNINYFHENRIAQTLSLHKSIGFENSFYNQRLINANDQSGGEYSSTTGYSNDSKFRYNMSINAIVEPRWYFGHVRRYVEDKSTENNSGWYLSLPIALQSNIVQCRELEQDNLFKENYNFIVAIGPNIGYRKSLSGNWFLEASFGYTPINYRFNDTDFYGFRRIRLASDMLNIDSYSTKLKIAYIIK